jgi:hypothetical protein
VFIASLVSVVIPALNEERTLARTLAHLRLSEGMEVVVADGGSTDRTREIAREHGCAVVESPRGRARQMNAGARAATGDIFLFLHADCTLPAGAFEAIREALVRPGVVAGAFYLSIAHPALRFRLIEFFANIRSRLTRVPYGDQGLFLGREAFERVGGFPDIPFMEDIALGRILRRMGRIAFLRPPIGASARRWLREGALRTTLLDWRLALSYSLLRVPPERLAALYRDVR